MKYLLLLVTSLVGFVSPIQRSDTGSVSVLKITNSQFCDGAPTGAIDLGVEGGFSPITYIWSGGPNGDFSAETEDIKDLSPGEYCVTITDGLCGVARLCVTVGCEEQCPNIALENLEDAITHPTWCSSSDGSIHFRFGGATGGTEPYDITLYDNQKNIVARPDYSLFWKNLSAGEYTFVAEDTNGCSASFEFKLTPQFNTLAGNTYTKSPCLPTASSSQGFGLINPEFDNSALEKTAHLSNGASTRTTPKNISSYLYPNPTNGLLTVVLVV